MRTTVLFVLALSLSAAAQESGVVTIYAAGGWSKGTVAKAVSGLVVTGDAPSIANLFDGKQKLAYLTPGRFLSIELPPGKHVLAASREFDHPDGKAPVELVVEPGGHYFYRMRISRAWVGPLQTFTGRLDPVSCKEALAEADAHEPISIKRVEKERRFSLVDAVSFPKCK